MHKNIQPETKFPDFLFSHSGLLNIQVFWDIRRVVEL
jgi:hypothetical protein